MAPAFRFATGLLFGVLVGGINHWYTFSVLNRGRALGVELAQQMTGRFLIRFVVDFAAFMVVYLVFGDPLAIGGTLMGLLLVLAFGTWTYVRKQGGFAGK